MECRHLYLLHTHPSYIYISYTLMPPISYTSDTLIPPIFISPTYPSSLYLYLLHTHIFILPKHLYLQHLYILGTQPSHIYSSYNPPKLYLPIYIYIIYIHTTASLYQQWFPLSTLGFYSLIKIYFAS